MPNPAPTMLGGLKCPPAGLNCLPVVRGRYYLSKSCRCVYCMPQQRRCAHPTPFASTLTFVVAACNDDARSCGCRASRPSLACRSYSQKLPSRSRIHPDTHTHAQARFIPHQVGTRARGSLPVRTQLTLVRAEPVRHFFRETSSSPTRRHWG